MAYTFPRRSQNVPPALGRLSDAVEQHPRLFVGASLFVGVLVGGLLGGLFGDRITHPRPTVTSGQNADVNGLMSRIARHFVIPLNEAPVTVATVAQPEELKAQSPVFYRDAIIGDRLLVWKDRAVLYSPSRDTVLAAMVALQVPTTTAQNAKVTPPEATTSTLSVEVRNASGVTGATKAVSDLVSGVSGFATSTVTNAKKTATGVLVVPVTDRAKVASLDALVKTVGGTIGTMPADEKETKADIVIFVGKK